MPDAIAAFLVDLHKQCAAVIKRTISPARHTFACLTDRPTFSGRRPLQRLPVLVSAKKQSDPYGTTYRVIAIGLVC